jgi:DNA-directed RNA polymerase subunit RPC12/RpoP
MYCPQCGYKIEFDSPKFCPKCGFNIFSIPKPTSHIEKFQIYDGKNNSTDIEVSEVLKEREKVGNEDRQINNTQQKSSHNIKTYPLHLSDSSMLKISWWDNFKDKWGYGWIFFGYEFFSPQVSKLYSTYGEYGSVLSLLGFILSMLFYFFLRQKFLIKIKKDWLRSTLSVVISYVIVSTILILAVLLINPSKNNDDVTIDWKLRNLPNAHLIIDSPSDFVQAPNKLPSGYNNIIESYFNYTNDTKSTSLIISIHFTKFQENVFVDVDKVIEGYRYQMNQTINGISNFQCSSSEYNIDGHPGKIVHGTLEINNKDAELLAAVLYYNSKLWQVICIYSVNAENKENAKRVIDSIRIED